MAVRPFGGVLFRSVGTKAIVDHEVGIMPPNLLRNGWLSKPVQNTRCQLQEPKWPVCNQRGTLQISVIAIAADLHMKKIGYQSSRRIARRFNTELEHLQKLSTASLFTRCPILVLLSLHRGVVILFEGSTPFASNLRKNFDRLGRPELNTLSEGASD
jgi:hypothetical protein